ncbi:MAG: amidohydrolase family protein [Psychromonas sp.]
MTEKIIYNCHCHTFTHKNIPNGYFPFFLVPAARVGAIRWGLRLIMKGIVPWTKNDIVHRYAAFIKAAYRQTQAENLAHLASYYPQQTKFIVLPMDMAYMGAGTIEEDIDEQHAELALLAKDPQYVDKLIPFAHIDPRRPDALNRLKSLVEEDNFKGVKIYPTLGYLPTHNVLMDDIYPYMIKKNIPLMAHCSPGSVNSKEISRSEAHVMADPYQYRDVMKAFPALRICLGHFGGIREWQRHINEPRDADNPTWLSKIRELIKSGDYPNLYTDISYTIFNYQDNFPLLNILLEDQQMIEKVLFGSDFYMVESEKYSEKRLSTDLRSSLGEKKFWKIANENPKAYLG